MTAPLRRKPLPTTGMVAVSSLQRRLGWAQLVTLGVGAIVGTGIYTLVGVGAERAGPAIILAFAVAGAVCALTALAYAELAAMMPQAGGAYSYTYAGMGELTAWMVGWALILEYSVACAAVGVGWSGYVVSALASIGVTLPHAFTAGPHAGGIVNVPAMLIVGVVAAVLMQGVRKSASLNAVLVVVKLCALALFVTIAFAAFRASNLHPFMPYGFFAQAGPIGMSGVMTAAAVVFFAFFGFDAVATAAEEVKRPDRDLPIGIIGSIAICTVIYMAVSAAAVGAVPFDSFAGDPAPLARVLAVLGHSGAALLISAAAVIALPTVILVMMYGQTRMFFAMARDGLLPARLAEVDPAIGAPRKVTALVAAIVALVAGFTPLREIAELTNAGTLTAFIAVSLCLLVLRRTAPGHRRPFRYPAAWLFAPLGAAGCAYLFVSLPAETLVRFAAWLALGLVVYFAYGRSRSRLAASAPIASDAPPKRKSIIALTLETSEAAVRHHYAAPWRHDADSVIMPSVTRQALSQDA